MLNDIQISHLENALDAARSLAATLAGPEYPCFHLTKSSTTCINREHDRATGQVAFNPDRLCNICGAFWHVQQAASALYDCLAIVRRLSATTGESHG